MESDSKSGAAADAAAAAAAGGGNGGGGRLLVDDVQSDRKRFEIELIPGETTIVSWAKLLKDSGIQVDHSPPPSPPEPPKRFHQEDESISVCSNVIFKKEKDEQNYRSLTTKKRRNAISEVVEGINVVQATKNTKTGHARVKSTIGQNYDHKKQALLSASMTYDRTAICAESQSITLRSHNEESSINNGNMELLPDLNVPYTVQAASTSPTHIKDEFGGMMNGVLLENTILEMQTMVAESRRLHSDVQDVDHSVPTKRKLPREIKQKLETIARLAHSSQGRISDELIMRLISILGHWLKIKTLKRCLRDMVPTDLAACGGDVVMFNHIKNEVIEMIKLRTLFTETKVGSSNESIELPAAQKVKYSMDHEMEDKICDFYDIYVQGMDEFKSSEIRKFYIQLAALWPKGTMDNHGIRNAICRAKERRRTLLQEKGHEKGKQKKSSTTRTDADLHGEANLIAEQKKPLNDVNTPVLTFANNVVPGTPELDQNLSAPAKRFSPPSAGCRQGLLKQEKFDILS